MTNEERSFFLLLLSVYIHTCPVSKTSKSYKTPTKGTSPPPPPPPSETSFLSLLSPEIIQFRATFCQFAVSNAQLYSLTRPPTHHSVQFLCTSSSITSRGHSFMNFPSISRISYILYKILVQTKMFDY